MSLYAPHQVAEAKAAITLSRVVAETTKLTRAGTNRWIAVCPFHGEKTPSLSVYDDHFHCFGCNAHGDAVAWLMKARKMTFCAAMLHLGATPEGGRPQAVQTTPDAASAGTQRHAGRSTARMDRGHPSPRHPRRALFQEPWP
jgi:DNA primase